MWGGGVFFGVAEVRERLEEVKPAVSGFGVLPRKPGEDFPESELGACDVKVDEVALRAAACDGGEFHARDVTRIGDRNALELSRREEFGVWIAKKTHLRPLGHGVDGVRRFGNQGKVGHRLEARKQGVLVKEAGREEVEIR
jgi:hypothetical protein